MLKELVFHLAGGLPRSALMRELLADPALSSRSRTLHSASDLVWELCEVTGESAALDRLSAVLLADRHSSIIEQRLDRQGPRVLQVVTSWRRIDDGSKGLVLDFLLHDIAGPDAQLFVTVRQGLAEIIVTGHDGDKLHRFFETVQQLIGSRFDIRLVRAGELRAPVGTPGPVLGRPVPGLAHHDREIIAVALAAGYYDDPKRCGVRELGESLGLSKSVVARRLRTIERRALEYALVP